MEPGDIGGVLGAIKTMAPPLQVLVLLGWFGWQLFFSKRMSHSPAQLGHKLDEIRESIVDELKAIRRSVDATVITQERHGAFLARIEKIEDKIDRRNEQQTNPELRRPPPR